VRAQALLNLKPNIPTQFVEIHTGRSILKGNTFQTGRPPEFSQEIHSGPILLGKIELLERESTEVIIKFVMVCAILFLIHTIAYLNRMKAEALRKLTELRIKRLRQISHDIKSPLSALDVLVGTEPCDFRDLDNQTILQETCDRLRKIIHSIDADHEAPGHTEGFNLHDALDSLLSEKKLNFPGIQFQFKDSETRSCLPSQVDPTKLLRSVSNLLNNAAESTQSLSFERDPVVKLESESNKRSLTIKVTDNGTGIPKAITTRIGDYRYSHGKRGGSGLGLSSLKENLIKWDAFLTIITTEHEGTTVHLNIPHGPRHPILTRIWMKNKRFSVVFVPSK